MFGVLRFSGALKRRGLARAVQKHRVVRAAVFMCTLFVMSAASFALPAPPAFDATPNPCCGVSFGQYGLGFSGSDLFLHTGDTIYKLGQDGGGNEEWQSHVTDIQNAFAGGPRVFEGGFATSPLSSAAVSMGFNDGGVLLVDLNSPTSTREVTALDTANVFSLAGAANGDFFGMIALPDFSSLTQIVRIDGGTGNVDVILNELDAGSASGGFGFDPDGNLIASSFDFIGGNANFFRIDRDDLDDPLVVASLVASVPANGNSNLVVNEAGDLFFISATGVGVIRNGTTTVDNFFGDLSADPFDLNGPLFLATALAIDPNTQELILIDITDPANASFVVLPTGATGGSIPEPSTALLAMFGLVGLTMGRRRA